MPKFVIAAHELLPPELRRPIQRIVDLLDPFEGYARITDLKDPDELRDLQLVLMAEGGYTPQLFEEVTRFGRRVPSFLNQVAQNRKLTPGAMSRLQDQFCRVIHALVIKRLHAERRVIAHVVVGDAMQAGTLFAMGKSVRVLGAEVAINSVMAEQHQGLYSVEQTQSRLQYLGWFGYADRRRWSEELVWPGFANGLTFADNLRLLNEVGLEVTQPNQVKFTLPPHLHDPFFPFGEISVPDMLDPTFLCVIRLWREDGQHLTCGISRITGDLVPGSMRFVSMGYTFEISGKPAHHEYLRAHCLSAVLQALESGQLREQAFISGQSVVERLAKLIPKPPAPVLSPPVAAASQPAQPPRVSRKPLDLPGAMKPGNGTERLVIREGRLSWRRIIAAFKRCGVSVDLSDNHPKLRLGRRATGFLGSHDRDQKWNRIALYQALEDLGISEHDFFRAL